MDISMRLPERIDTSNAQNVQEQINKLLMESGNDPKTVNIMLDAEDLQYISSAGLRAMLSIKKKAANLSIINASQDVVEIFKVTGFDEFITIKRKIEEISIDGLNLVGIGSSSRVYRLSNEKVVKVYKEGTPYETVLKEQEMIKKAILQGVDTIISYGIVKVGNSYGAIYEMLDAKTILQFIKEDPSNEDMYLRQFVDFVKKNHEIELHGSEIKSIKKLYYDRIDMLSDSGFYSADEAMTARQIIFSIPDKDTFIHGDCHIGNVMLSTHSNELYFIDLAAFSKGNPMFDLFGMAWLRLAPQILDNDRMAEIVGIDETSMERVWKKIISFYFDTEDKAIIDELDRQYTALECLNLSMAETFSPGLFTGATLEWLKNEGMKAADFEF